MLDLPQDFEEDQAKRETTNGKKTIGSKITDRLERFAANPEKVQDLDELQETLTVQKVVLNLSPRPFTGR